MCIHPLLKILIAYLIFNHKIPIYFNIVKTIKFNLIDFSNHEI